MTREQAKQIFIEEYCNGNIRKALREDHIAVRCAWNDFIDVLCKNGDITQHQYNTWLCPWAGAYK